MMTNQMTKKSCAMLMSFLIATNAFAAVGNYEKGVAAMKAGNLQRAEEFLSAVGRKDPNYGEALSALAQVRGMQGGRENDVKSKEEIEACRVLYAASSPNAPDCVQVLRDKWGNDLFSASVDSAVVDLVQKEEFSKKFDSTVYAVTSLIASPIEGEGINQAKAHIDQLELWSTDMTLAEGYREAAKDRLGHFYLGHFDAANKHCKLLFDAGKGNEPTTQQICQEAQTALGNFDRVTRNLNIKAIEDGFPGRSHHTFVPATQFAPASSLALFDPKLAKEQEAKQQKAQAQVALEPASTDWRIIAIGTGAVAVVAVALTAILMTRGKASAPVAAPAAAAAAAAGAMAGGISEGILRGMLDAFVQGTAPVRESKVVIAYCKPFGIFVQLAADKKSLQVLNMADLPENLQRVANLIVAAVR